MFQTTNQMCILLGNKKVASRGRASQTTEALKQKAGDGGPHQVGDPRASLGMKKIWGLVIYPLVNITK
jgi:hypothetical protein